MLDIGWQELFIVAILALIIVGPKDLPQVIRTVSGLIRKARGMAREFQNGLDEVVREAELDDLKKDLETSGQDMRRDMVDDIDPTGDLTGEMDFTKEQLELEAAANAEPEADEGAAPKKAAERKAPEAAAEKAPEKTSEKASKGDDGAAEKKKDG